MNRPAELVMEIRACALELRAFNAGLEHVTQAFTQDESDPDVLMRVDSSLKEQMALRVDTLVTLFDEAESIGLMSALMEASLKLGVDFV